MSRLPLCVTPRNTEQHIFQLPVSQERFHCVLRPAELKLWKVTIAGLSTVSERAHALASLVGLRISEFVERSEGRILALMAEGQQASPSPLDRMYLM